MIRTPEGDRFDGPFDASYDMAKDFVAQASTRVDAPVGTVWQALIDPAAIKQYMFDTTVTSDWKKGSRIVWKGEWQGRQYEDKGEILDVIPNKRLRYTHFSPLAGQADKPENYHTVSIDIAPDGPGTRVSLSQSNNATDEERAHSQKNWEMMLAALKKYVEA